MNFELIEIIAVIGIAVTVFCGIAGLYDISEFIIKPGKGARNKKEEPMPIPEKIIPITKVQGIPESAHPYRSPADIENPAPLKERDIVKPPIKVNRVKVNALDKTFTSPIISINPANFDQSTKQSIDIKFDSGKKSKRKKFLDIKNRVCPRCNKRYIMAEDGNTVNLKCQHCNISITCDMTEDINRWIETANRMIR